MDSLTLDFAGEIARLDPSRSFVIGREGDLAIDDNLYLHRRFLELRHEHGIWWLMNVGAQLTATVSDQERGVHAWLAPGGRMPVVFDTTQVRFTAGPTQYEFHLLLDNAPYMAERGDLHEDGATTIGRVALTRDQRLMLVALAEGSLRRGAPGAAELPTSAMAAQRLGWGLKKFEKKIDNVCEKMTAHGVRGLKGDAGNLASSRRARLVEYVLAARIITPDDLALLEEHVSSLQEGVVDE